MSKPEMKEKQCVEEVCQFCTRDGFHDEEAHEPAEELQDSWLVLSDVNAQLWGIYGEWCSIECFWNDLLCQMTSESETDCKNKNTTLRQKIECRSPSYLHAP
jgi:hypothetical protein